MRFFLFVLCMSISTVVVADEYLGKLSSNPYGHYGSEYSSDNLNNEYGAGSPYRADSPNNPYGEGMSIYGDDDG